MRLLSRVTRAFRSRRSLERAAREALRSLANMSDAEILPRFDLSDAVRTPADLLVYFRARRMSFPLFRASERQELARLIGERFSSSRNETLRRADLASRHVVKVLGSEETDLGDPINWWTDFKGNTWAQGDYQELNATLFANDFQDERYIGDIKLPWELNKHAHFVELGKASDRDSSP